MPKFTSATARAAGRSGGLATVKRHGREHMRKIGKLGFRVTVQRHYGGDARLAINTLIARGLAAIDPMPYNGAWQGGVIDRLPKDWKEQ